jgi:hypothetical protein
VEAMTEDDLNFLKSKIRMGSVKLCFTDGEEAVVKIVGVSDSEKDVIYDVVSSNRDEPIYKKGSIVARFEDIKSVSEAA